MTERFPSLVEKGVMVSLLREGTENTFSGGWQERITDKNGDNLVHIDPNDPEKDELMEALHYYPSFQLGVLFGDFFKSSKGALRWNLEWDTPIFDQNGNSLSETGVENRYTYNGKEFQDDLGVNLHYYGFRVYDPAIARFTGVDPISDQFPHVSTFNYAENEPMANIDLHGLQKVSVHSLGQLKINGVAANVGIQATLDIGNRNSFSYSLQIQGIGTATGSYSKDSGHSQSIHRETDLPSIGFEIRKKHGIGIPDFIAEYGVTKAKEAFTPESVEEALNLSEEDQQFNNIMTTILSSVSDLIFTDVLDASVGYDGSKGIGKKEDGTPYERKFTKVYSGKIDDFSFSEKGISYQGKLLIQYTDQKCTKNCDEEK
ncbi:MAG: RHS repeat-associated core domain-containing protein [Saprospiraceae bacterium]|nr:RHS repeat-associated core domain-containing protein [Saprospiraceae bacterium]